MPEGGLRGHEFSGEERATVLRNVAQVRGSADWIEQAITIGGRRHR